MSEKVPPVRPCALPRGALLVAYAQSNGYADCYCVDIARAVSQSEFVEAFYTSAVFKVERWLLGRLLAQPSTDAQAHQLAAGGRRTFAAWSVEQQTPHQILLAAGRTRSWLMAVAAEPGNPTTRLYFGSAVVPRRRSARSGQPRMGWPFQALLGFHRMYSRILLAAACRKLALADGHAAAYGRHAAHVGREPPVLEVAPLHVRAGLEAEFEAAFLEAQRIIAAMPGYLSHELRRCVERPSEFVLLVRWESLEAHEVGFRKSPQYQEWKRLLHHFYEPFPVVSHYAPVQGASAARPSIERASNGEPRPPFDAGQVER